MHFAVADLHKWRRMDGWNHWIAIEPQVPWSPGDVTVGVNHEATFGVTLPILSLKKGQEFK